MNVCGTIITFNPEIERLERNLESLFNQLDFVIVIDNSSNNIDLIDSLIKKHSFNNIHLIKNTYNRGLAYALNQSFDIAKEFGYVWNITMDQDSILQSNYTKDCLSIIEDSNNDKLAIICPQIQDINIYYDNKGKMSNNYEATLFCITSGAFTNIDVFRKIGGLENKMFIDQLDLDLCLNMRKNSYIVLKNYNSVLNHRLGNISNHKFFGFKFITTNHSKERLFYIYRNFYYIKHKFKNLIRNDTEVKSWFKKNKKSFFIRIIKILIAEDQKLSKLTYIFKGIYASRKMINNEN